MNVTPLRYLPLILGVALSAAAGCTPAAPPAPTAAPAKPAATAAPAKPAATAAPAKPAASPAVAASPVAAAPPVAKPAASPAAKPAASPAASPAAKPAASPAAAAAIPTLPAISIDAAARSAAESFYRGKTVRIVVGLSAGGGYDTIARLVGRYMGRYIPGNPTIVVENQTGAAGAVAANTLFNTAPKDGTALHLFAETLVQRQMLGAQGIQFDARQWEWLGSTQTQTIVCIARTDAGINSLQDLMGGAGKTLRVGSTGPGTNTHDFPTVLKGALNASIEVVPGYPGTNEIRLAMERGETNGACIPWESLKVTSAAWFTGASPFAKVIVQQATEKHPDLPQVPFATEAAQNQDQRQMIQAITGALAISKPFVAPPGVPAERVQVLRSAFAATLNDAELRADAQRTRQELFPRTAEATQRIAQDILNTPPVVIERLKGLLTGG